MNLTLCLLLLWLLHPISVIISLVQRFKKDIPVYNAIKNSWFKNWKIIQSLGLISGLSLLSYISIILIFGWTFRSYLGLIILQVVLFVVLDRYLISVNYSKIFWEQSKVVSYSRFVFAKILSYLFIICRVGYIVYCICAIPVLFAAQTGFTIDTFIYGIYGEIFSKSRLLDKHTPFGTEINYTDGLNKIYSSTAYFNGKVIFYWEENSPENIYLFISKLGVFMKYVNPSHNMIYYNVDLNGLEYDDDKKILYVDSSENVNRSKIEHIDGNFYLEYYTSRFTHDNKRDTSQRIKTPVRIKL